jgi:hypothetical protein
MKTANDIQEKKLKKLKKLASEFTEKAEEQIYGLCEILDYKKSSQFSFLIDRLKQFNNDLSEFKL